MHICTFDTPWEEFPPKQFKTRSYVTNKLSNTTSTTKTTNTTTSMVQPRVGATARRAKPELAAIGPLRRVTPYLTGCKRVSVGGKNNTTCKQQRATTTTNK